jgi:hypothetical protein
VPHIAVPFRSRCRSVRTPCCGRRCPRCRGVRAPGVRQAASGVHASGQPVSAGRVDLALDQCRRATTSCAALPWCRNGGCGSAAILPQPAGSQTLWPVAGWLRNRTPRTPWLSAAASGTAVAVRRVGVRTVGVQVRCPDGWCPDGRCPPRPLPQPAGVHGYRNRSPGRRTLDGRRHRRYARASWRPSRSPSWART